MRPSLLVAIAAGLLLATPASAVTWTSVEREAWVDLRHPGSQLVEWGQTGTGPWSGTFRDEEGMFVTDPFGDETFVTWFGQVVVDSDVAADGLDYFAATATSAPIEEYPQITWLPRAGTTLAATFVIDDPHRITLTGTMEGFDAFDPGVFSSFVLTGPGGPLLSFRTSIQDQLFIELDSELDLAPGTYGIEIELVEHCYCSSEFPFEAENPRVDLSLAFTPLVVPEPGIGALLAAGFASVAARWRARERA